MRLLLALFLTASLALSARAQDPTPAGASGGPLHPEQAAYDVGFYGLDVWVRPETRTIEGTLEMRARTVHPTHAILLHLDDAFAVASITGADGGPLRYERGPGTLRVHLGRTAQPGDALGLTVAYSGAPRVAPRPPWDGGFTWAESADGRPWIGVSVQGEGADLWWPVKDHPSDKPDSIRVSVRAPADLQALANGRFQGRTDHGDGTATSRYAVSNPIAVYNVSLGIGPFETVERTYESPHGYTMPARFYVLPERRADAERVFDGFLDHVRYLEDTFGPYAFRADGYNVLHTPYLGMEHQNLVAYGSTFSDNAFGFDWLHFHELAHEWWANTATAPDWRDFWVHESFASYSEALYAEHLARGSGAADPYGVYLAYLHTSRGRLANVLPVAPKEPRTTKEMYALPDGGFNGDIYFKGAWFLHQMRVLMDDDAAFFRALRRAIYPDPALEMVSDGRQVRFVSTVDVQAALEREARRDLSAYVAVWLRQPALPRLVAERAGSALRLRWETPEASLPPGLAFEMPVEVEVGGRTVRVPMPGGEGRVEAPAGAIVRLDPRGQLLADVSPLD